MPLDLLDDYRQPNNQLKMEITKLLVSYTYLIFFYIGRKKHNSKWLFNVKNSF